MPHEPTCLIVAAGEYRGEPVQKSEGDYVIAADGGFALCRTLNLKVDEVIGDFDSLGFEPEHRHVTRLPVEKDDTDTMHALRVGYARGYRRFEIHAGTGGRLDHTLANIQSLCWLADKGARGILFDGDVALTVIKNATLALKGREGDTVSVFAAAGDARGVTIRGLKYEAERITLTGTFPLGVSNALTGREAAISVDEGLLLICAPAEAYGERRRMKGESPARSVAADE